MRPALRQLIQKLCAHTPDFDKKNYILKKMNVNDFVMMLLIMERGTGVSEIFALLKYLTLKLQLDH